MRPMVAMRHVALAARKCRPQSCHDAMAAVGTIFRHVPEDETLRLTV